MSGSLIERVVDTLGRIRESGLYKNERVITSPQSGCINVPGAEGVLNLCANNYLGLANHPEIITAAKQALDTWGYGMASVRFICGTQQIHKQLEEGISDFLGTEDTILYSSCFDANGGLFETLLGAEDAVVSDELNHASVIDGIRLCKAARYRYANNDLGSLDEKLSEAREKGASQVMIATDGVFSMDGTIADLAGICELAEKYHANVMVDDSHAVGFLGADGRGSHEHCGVVERVDVITGTLGKALGGASGGYTSGRREIIEMLRQRSRPYLFSNTLAPAIAAASLKALDLVGRSGELRRQLWENTAFFRGAIESAGFDVIPGEHPIVPIMLGDASLAARMAERLLEEGIYVVAFSYPVVPKGKARIRCQLSSALKRSDLELAVEKFVMVKKELEI
ncbi:MAG: glycine C-acetyltransferase [Verrucomicrobiaceae bacterium]|nr:glycine C-acetyltransferase [Verrucomicrobiaceae bacterium]